MIRLLRRRIGQATVFLWFFLVAVLGGCDRADESGTQAPPLPVVVTTAERRDVPLSLEMVGSTLGTQDVPIRARVEGFLETMNFQEGRFVGKGDLLYTIDPEQYEAELVEAQSQLAAAQTNLAKTDSDLNRIRPLAEIKAVSEQDLDAAVALEAAARAAVRAAEAGVDLARITLSYTRIKAPIAGLIGLTKAKPGEFVGREPNPVVLNVLSDIDPIRVRFSISESEYLTLARTYLQEHQGEVDRRRQQTAVGGTTEGARRDLVLILADGTEHPAKGWVVAASQAIDPGTGTYTIEAAFPNPGMVLLPGQFARVRAPYQTLDDVVVVPRMALIELQGSFRVYIVNAEQKVEIREVVLGPIKGPNVVIEAGLQGGESVILEGLQKVRPGIQVSAGEAPPPDDGAPMQET